MKEKRLFTIEEIRTYFLGWRLVAAENEDIPNYALLHNALQMLEDERDGIAAVCERLTDLEARLER